MTYVANLVGAELAGWVAMAQGLETPEIVNRGTPRAVCQYIHHHIPGDEGWWTDYRPHEDWAQAGKLIDKYKISIIFEEYGDGQWEAGNIRETGEHASCENRMYGPTALIAAMRSMVHGVYGEKVPD